MTLCEPPASIFGPDAPTAIPGEVVLSVNPAPAANVGISTASPAAAEAVSPAAVEEVGLAHLDSVLVHSGSGAWCRSTHRPHEGRRRDRDDGGG